MLDLLRCLHNPSRRLVAGDCAALADLRLQRRFGCWTLRLLEDERGDTLPLWQALQRADAAVRGIDAHDLPRLQFARQTLSALRAMAGRVSISELLRQALAATDYRAILTGLPDGGRRRGNIDKRAAVG